MQDCYNSGLNEKRSQSDYKGHKRSWLRVNRAASQGQRGRLSGETEEDEEKEEEEREGGKKKTKKKTADQLLPLYNQHIAFKSTHRKASGLDSMNSTGGRLVLVIIRQSVAER